MHFSNRHIPTAQKDKSANSAIYELEDKFGGHEDSKWCPSVAERVLGAQPMMEATIDIQ